MRDKLNIWEALAIALFGGFLISFITGVIFGPDSTMQHYSVGVLIGFIISRMEW